ncbi:MAG: hypothetical protein QM820_51485 [Minicystis sp.]
MTRFAPISALGLAAASTLFAGLAAAQPAPAPAPPAGVPAAAGAPPPPPPPAVAGAATAIPGVTTEYVAKPDFKAPRKPNGWETHVAVGGTVSFANNSSVAGQMDGTSFSVGLKLDSAADFNHFNHEWRNSLALGASITRTPVIPEFVKTNDSLTFESIYLYHVVDWFGPFVRFQLNTAMFPGRDVRTGKASYVITNPDGTTRQLSVEGTDCTLNADGVLPQTCRTSLSLSDGFRPLTFEQIGRSLRAAVPERAGDGRAPRRPRRAGGHRQEPARARRRSEHRGRHRAEAAHQRQPSSAPSWRSRCGDRWWRSGSSTRRTPRPWPRSRTRPCSRATIATSGS